MVHVRRARRPAKVEGRTRDGRRRSSRSPAGADRETWSDRLASWQDRRAVACTRVHRKEPCGDRDAPEKSCTRTGPGRAACGSGTQSPATVRLAFAGSFRARGCLLVATFPAFLVASLRSKGFRAGHREMFPGTRSGMLLYFIQLASSFGSAPAITERATARTVRKEAAHARRTSPRCGQPDN